MESPVKGDFRLSRVRADVGGVDIPPGTTVMVVNGAANRDPREFEKPNEFQVDRGNARHHLAFGLGIHVCPGAPLARAEAKVSLERRRRLDERRVACIDGILCTDGLQTMVDLAASVDDLAWEQALESALQ